MDTPAVPFALLDEHGATAAAQSALRAPSRLYTDLVREHICTDVARLDHVYQAIAADLHAGLHAVVLIDYEWGVALAGLQSRHQHSDRPPAALRCMMFRQLRRLSSAEVEQWLAAREADGSDEAGAALRATELAAAPAKALPPQGQGVSPPACAGVMDLQASVTRAEFDAALDGVQAALQAGDAYQINYTFRLDFNAYGSPLALYRRLRARQPVSYGALIALPDQRWVLSCSPELFVDHHQPPQRMLARPMKGTAPRLTDPEADRQAGQALALDPKNRAENLMIVDLLRNDLGRIAQTGSVRVPALFAVEGHPTVWQMTSSVEAQLAPNVDFAAVLRALFPCGSITGAPKHRAMQLIDALESTPRGLYTGAIGWLEAPEDGVACGPFCLSVAIRTLTLDAAGADGLRAGRMGVGGGIVLDSRAADEFDECFWKARFLTGLDPGFSLFETMRATPQGEVLYLEQHLARLAGSAERLGFVYESAALRQQLQAYLATLAQSDQLAPDGFRVRAALDKSGQLHLTSAPLTRLPASTVPLLLACDLGFAATQADDPLLGFKTTRRHDYDAAWQAAEQQGAFDALFFNTAGELTEGGRSNVFVKLDGRWWTPPLASGVLPGVMRERVLTDPQWAAGERRLTREDLSRAQALMVCNALRGVLAAQLRLPAQPN